MNNLAANVRPLKILFVEDEQQIRKLISLTLRSFGYDLTDAEDGRQALQQMDQDGFFDLLLTDLVLPGGVGGQEVAKVFKKKFPDGRVIYSSGFLDQSAASQSEAVEGIDVLIKPYDVEALVAAIDKLS